MCKVNKKTRYRSFMPKNSCFFVVCEIVSIAKKIFLGDFCFAAAQYS